MFRWLTWVRISSEEKGRGWFPVPTMISARPICWQWRADWLCPSVWPPPRPSRTWEGRSWAASPPRSGAWLSPPTSQWWNWTCWAAPVRQHSTTYMIYDTNYQHIIFFTPEILAKLYSLSVSINFNRSFGNFVQGKSRSLNSLDRCIQLKTINIM